jgi:2-hydroxychromene-2-carboxylate isomerase
MAHVDYYFSPFSPFTYLAGPRFQAVAERHKTAVTYKPLDIVALFARTGGTAPADRHDSRKAYRMQELRRQAIVADLPLNPMPAHFPTNQAPASYAIIAAQAAGGGDLAGLVHAFGRACWAEEKDIADDAVIRDCLAGAGFDPSLADSGLLAGAETYGRNLEDAVSAGAFGAPFWITDQDQRFWGQDRIADLDAHLAGTL